jgi:hypothetical protein
VDDDLPLLPDGRYDVVVSDASDSPGEVGGLRVELTIVAGERSGDLVTLRSIGVGRSWVEIIGLPGTVTVEAGQPHLRLDG